MTTPEASQSGDETGIAQNEGSNQFTRLPQLRITVNSRCGRACFFCRPSGEAVSTKAGTELDPNTAFEIVDICTKLGVSDVKITGGDPALWNPLVACAARIKSELNCHLDVISRHPKIADHAEGLADAGVDLFNMSVDTLDSDLHKKITGIDDLPSVLAALAKCVDSGIETKVNMVVMSGINDHEIDAIIEFCERNGVKQLKLLDLMTDLEDGEENYSRRLQLLGVGSLRDIYLPLDVISEKLHAKSVDMRVFQQAGLGNPMKSFKMPSGLEVIVKDHHAGAYYGSICKGCNHYPCHSALMAIRLTADARIQYCLLREDICVDTKLLTERSAIESAIKNALTVYDKATFHPGPEGGDDHEKLELPIIQ